MHAQLTEVVREAAGDLHRPGERLQTVKRGNQPGRPTLYIRSALTDDVFLVFEGELRSDG